MLRCSCYIAVCAGSALGWPGCSAGWCLRSSTDPSSPTDACSGSPGRTRPGQQKLPRLLATRPRSVLWTHNAPVLDQGDLGACTGFALAQCLNAARFVASRPKRRYLNAQYGRLLYAKATTLDEFPGQWPTQDTGSSGLAVAKAGVTLGYLQGYDHGFGVDYTASALQLQLGITGVNWYSDMYEPGSDGFLHVGAAEGRARVDAARRQLSVGVLHVAQPLVG